MPVPGSLKRKPVDEGEVADTLETKFGLPRNETRAYLRLLEGRDLTLSQVAEALGVSVDQADAVLERMKDRGIVIESSDAKFVPLHPRMTLTNIFKVYEKEVVQSLRDRRAAVDRIVNLLTPVFEERKR